MSAALLRLLEQAEALINLDERGDALGVLAEVRKCLAPTSPAKETDTDEVKSISERVEAVRIQLFDSMAMVDVASRAVSPDKDWPLRHTLEVVGRQIDAACATLELIGIDARERQEVGHG